MISITLTAPAPKPRPGWLTAQLRRANEMLTPEHLRPQISGARDALRRAQPAPVAVRPVSVRMPDQPVVALGGN